MRNFTIWENYVINTEDIVQKIDLRDCHIFTSLEVTEKNKKMLNKFYIRLNKCDDLSDVEKILDKNGLEWRWGSAEDPANLFYYSYDNFVFGIINNLSTQKFYTRQITDKHLLELWEREQKPLMELVVDDEQKECIEENIYKYPIASIDNEQTKGKSLIVKCPSTIQEEWDIVNA